MPHPAKLDPLYETAKQLILDTKVPTISLIQRHLKISYEHALGLMAALEGDVVTAIDADTGLRKMLIGETVGLENRARWMREIEWPCNGDDVAGDHLHITCSCFSQKAVGKVRNDDAILLPHIRQQGTIRESGSIDLSKPRCFAVADGVSSDAMPGMASMSLLSRLSEQMRHADENTSLSSLFCQLQKEYAKLGAHRSKYYGMASTLVGARLVGNTATIFNVGDSRAYLLTIGANGCHAQLLSRDHNQLNEMLDAGEITPEQAKSAASIYRGLTSQFIADTEFDAFKVHIVTHTLQPGERLLLCSDGLNEVLNDAEIAAIFSGNSDEDLMNAYKASRRAGGRDDFSAIVIELLD